MAASTVTAPPSNTTVDDVHVKVPKKRTRMTDENQESKLVRDVKRRISVVIQLGINNNGVSKTIECVNNLVDILVVPHLVNKQEERARRNASKVRDPNAPVDPRSPWQLFLAHQREEMKKAGSKIDKAVMQNAGQLWKALNEADRQVWVDKYNELAAIYQNELAAYTKTKAAPADNQASIT